MKQSLLLLEDVDRLGRSGEIVSVKAGFARNFLLPQKKAVRASRETIKLQEQLQEERAKQAKIDFKKSQELAQKLENVTVVIEVKVDTEGNLYGSVTAQDIANLLKEQQEVELDKRNVLLPKPLKKLGIFPVSLRLQEDVPATISVEIKPEKGSVIKKAFQSMKRDAELDKEEKKEEEEKNKELADEAKSEKS